MNSFFSYLSKWINANPGKALGGLGGFLAGILTLTLGPVKTLVIILFVILGVLVGKLKDDNIISFDWFKRRKNRDTYDDEDF